MTQLKDTLATANGKNVRAYVKDGVYVAARALDEYLLAQFQSDGNNNVFIDLDQLPFPVLINLISWEVSLTSGVWNTNNTLTVNQAQGSYTTNIAVAQTIPTATLNGSALANRIVFPGQRLTFAWSIAGGAVINQWKMQANCLRIAAEPFYLPVSLV